MTTRPNYVSGKRLDPRTYLSADRKPTRARPQVAKQARAAQLSCRCGPRRKHSTHRRKQAGLAGRSAAVTVV